MKNIVLTGFMGAGKTSVGKKLSEKTGMKVIDTDDKIEEDTGMSIPDIFEKMGEIKFRELEKKAVEEVSKLSNHIIITGGGVVLNKENMDNLKKNGTIVYLYADPAVIYERIKNETHRPLLRVKDPKKKIKELMEYRAPFYANHDIKIDTSNLTVDEVVDEILKALKDKL
jgi:shikimate kinase